MSAFNYKKKSSGLRILWIPGRKKHGRKGRVETTQNRVDYSGKQKQIEPWSLGGSKGQEGLIRADISGQSEGPSISSVLPASCAIAANVPLQSNMKLEEETNKFATLDLLNEEINHEQKHEQNEYQQIEKHNTLPLNDKRDARQQQIQDDVNSIELIGEKCLSEDKFDIDRPDGSLNNITKKNNHKKKNKKKKKKNKSDDEYQTQEEEDKVVTCLYYTLMCCECSIS